MARYAKVDVRIWDDDKVKAMTPIPHCGQGLWIRLLVSRHRSPVPGLLCVGEAALAEEFGWTLEDFRKAFAEAASQDIVKADWKARFVWIPNACFYNPPESPNVVKSWRVSWDEAPECDLKNEAYRHLRAFIEGFGEGFRKAFAEACPEPSPNQEQEQEQEQQQEQEISVCPETPEDERSAPAEPPVLTYPCDGMPKAWSLTQSKLDEWAPLFPTLDLPDLCRQALAWVMASPDRRKTAKGMERFLVSWFGREKNSGRRPARQVELTVNRDIRVGQFRAEIPANSESLPTGDQPI